MTEFKDKRLAAGIKQTDLSSMTGIPVRTIKNYETGKTTPNTYRAQILADSLGVNVKAIFPLKDLVKAEDLLPSLTGGKTSLLEKTP